MQQQTKVLLFGTHPCCYNGYCLVTYNLAKEIAKYDDIELALYGFQNFYSNPAHNAERDLPPNVYMYDAYASETPKHMGFGFDQVKEFVETYKPDVCVLYNDMVVVSTIINKLKEVQNPTFKVIVYIDQVYLYQKTEYVKLLNESADFVIAFTPYWETIAKEIGITKPMGFLRHGFDPMVNYPMPKPLARQYFGLKKEDFIVMNLNRNQPRKRWDICLMAFAEFVSRHKEEPVKLLVATAVQGAWNLLEVYERELKKRGMTLEEGMKHMILIDNPQQLTDEDVNILYNVADIGINTCDGEGFGLCNFQQAAIGVPQIVPHIGGFLDFFDDSRAAVVQPKFNLYIDSGRDGVGGESQLCDWRDFAEALESLYSNQDKAQTLAMNARQHIIKEYAWSDITAKFRDMIHTVCKKPELPEPAPTSKVPIKLIEQWESELGLDKKLSTEENENAPEKPKKTRSARAKERKEELLELKAKIDRLLLEKKEKRRASAAKKP
jgi:glycosyltransferase involved in cell wall biosynthesis